MSTPANVLAVMYRAATEELPLMAAVDMWDARAAVAELIAAAEACLPDMHHHAYTHGPGPDLRLRDLRAALSRVGGAK